ncbi:MAG TPA: hypothetical protein VK935_12895 [Actinomycetospora sp.]|nr:hypothetical protein [Actinomycetospora sp.]
MVLLLLWVVPGVAPLLVSWGDVQLAAGAVGTPGTLTVEQCTELGKGRYDCDGVFVPDDGGPVVAVAASPDSTAGDVRRAQLAPEGDRAVPAGTSGVLAALTVPFLGVVVLAFLPAVALWALGSATASARRSSAASGWRRSVPSAWSWA